VVQSLGAEHVLAGSDYPHPEGLANPAEFADEITTLPPVVRRQILRDNFLTGAGLTKEGVRPLL
jgi:hypothetical protein